MRIRILFSLMCLLVFLFLKQSCEKNPTSSDDAGSVTDVDGNVYQTVKIGGQWWMVENLRVTHYRNGDPLTNVTDSTQWANLNLGAFCNYENKTSYVSDYGHLYNWYAVKDDRGLAPKGWTVPSDDDWLKLEDFVNGYGSELKESGLKHWHYPNSEATNGSGFSALPGGFRDGDATFNDIQYSAYFWTSTSNCVEGGYYKKLDYNDVGIAGICFQGDYRCGMSIRCVKK
jgi:uncharacterized protein (TIGR02145 family)